MPVYRGCQVPLALPGRMHAAAVDVYVQDERTWVVDAGSPAPIPPDFDEVDGGSYWLIPGLVDLRTHLRDPGFEYKEDLRSGLRAAAKGGFTTVCAMPNTSPCFDNRQVVDWMLRRAREENGPTLLPFGALSKGLLGEELSEMADLRLAGCVGVTDDLRPVTNTALFRRALEYAAAQGLLVMQHCEDIDLSRGAVAHEGVFSTRLGLRGSPRAAEESAVASVLRLLESCPEARLHIPHLSARGSVDLIRQAKEKGLRVSADVSPHHLRFTDRELDGYQTAAKVWPPLRAEEDRQALLAGVRDGTIDCIASDHAPHAAFEKDSVFDDAAPGVTSLELTLPIVCELIANGELERDRALDALTLAPRRVLQLATDLDFTLVSPTRDWQVSAQTLASKSCNTLLAGKRVLGAAVLTVAREHVLYHDRTKENEA